MEKFFSAAAVALLTVSAAQAAPGLITNGDFEDTRRSDGGVDFVGSTLDGDGAQFQDQLTGTGGSSWDIYPNGVYGWSVAPGSDGVEIQSNGTINGGGPINSLEAFDGSDGNFYAELDSDGGNSLSKIEQVIEDAVPGLYTLSFFFSPRQGDPASDGIAFGVDPVLGEQKLFSTDNSAAENAAFTVGVWTLVERSFTLTQQQDLTVFFMALPDEDTLGGFIDNISLPFVPSFDGEVPLPAGGILLVTGLAGLAMRRRTAR